MALSANKLGTMPVGKHHDGLGLYFHVREGARGKSHSWLLKFMLQGKAHDMGLGQVRLKGDPDTRKLTLVEAREARDEARALLKRGINPIEARKGQLVAEALQSEQEALHALTFEEVAQEFLAAKGAGLGSNAKHRSQWPQSLKSHVYPVIGNMPVRDIDTASVLKVMKRDEFWNKKTETAKRVLGRIESVIAYASVHQYRTGANPATWKGHLSAALPKPSTIKKKKHQASLHYGELAAFMSVLQAKEGTALRALEFMVLTAVRVGDITGEKQNNKPGCLWSQIDMKAQTWTVPATKNSGELVVPLSVPALSLLDRMWATQIDERVFPIGYTGIYNGLKALGDYRDKKTGQRITLHGFRSTFSTWRAECSGFNDELGEAALAHKYGNKVMQDYQRGTLLEKRRPLMQAWADFATARREVPNVVPIKRRK
jgi:integrase